MPRRSLSNDSKTDSEVGSRVGPGEEKKKDSFLKLETKSRSSHSKRRSVSSKREKHRWSKKKDSRKCLSKKFSDTIEKSDCNVDGTHGNSLLKRLQAMMATNVSVRKENSVVESVKKNEDSVKGQELEHGLRNKVQNQLPPVVAVKSNNENTEGSTETANQNHLDIEVFSDIKQPEPVVITIEDSDSEPQISADILECDSTEKVNKKDEIEITGDKTSAKGTDDIDEDEDLVQLRLLALQSNRRKETSKPKVEDDEVMQLRLEALKSAILKKCQVRKQRGVTLKSKKVNTISSPATLELEVGNEKGDLGHETLKPDISSVEAVPSEPDETTTLVDMDLSHTDDESSAQNDIIISGDVPLPKDSENAFLQLMHEGYSKQNAACNNEPLLKVREDKLVDLTLNQCKDPVLSAWNPTAAICRSPEAAKLDQKTCQLPVMCTSSVQIPSLNSVDYSSSQVPFPSSSYSQQQLYNELYNSNNSSDLPSADLDGVPLEALSSPFDSHLSPAVSGSFVSPNLNSSGISDALLVSRIEPQVVSTNSFFPVVESPSLKTDFTNSSIGIHVPRTSSVPAMKDSQFFTTSSITPRTETEAHRRDSVMYTQLCKMDPSTICQNWDRNKEVDLHAESYVSFKKLLPAALTKPACMAGDNSSLVFPLPPKLPASSVNPQIQEFKGMKTEVPCQSHSVSVRGRDSVEHKTDFKVEENSNELEKIDISNMIVLDEVGRCSSPEAKVEDTLSELVTSKTEDMSQQCEQSSVSLDEDEEILRAKVLTTLMRKSFTSEVPGTSNVFSKQQTKSNNTLLSVSPKPISPFSISTSKPLHQISVIHRKEKTLSRLSDSVQNLKGCNKITQRLLSKKVEHSQSNFSSYSKGNSIRTKWWKKSVRKGFSGTSIKQVVTGVNRNPGHMKQIRVPLSSVTSDAKGMGIELKKASITQCKPVGNPISRVVFCPRVSKPATIQVTVPTVSVDDEQCRRNIAESVTSSVSPVQHMQRFVIRLGEDSDSQDEEDKIQQMTQAPKRRCVIKNDSSVPLLTVSTSTTHVVPCDKPTNCDSTIAPSLLSHLDHPLADKQNTCSVPTQPVSNSGISADFEKSVDIFLKQARKSQEARANSVMLKNLAPNKSAGGKANPVVSSVTPLVRIYVHK